MLTSLHLQAVYSRRRGLVACCKVTITRLLAAYDQIGGTRMVHAACWAHARRQFFEAVQLNPRDPVATPIVARIDELFAVDAETRRKALTTAARAIFGVKKQPGSSRGCS